MRTLAFVVAAVATLLVSVTAQANIAAPRADPALFGELRAGAAGLRVTGEDLTISCRAERARPICEFEARYRVENPSTAPQALLVAFYGLYTERVRVRVDRRTVSTIVLDRKQAMALDARVAGVLRQPAGRRPRPWPQRGELLRTGFMLRAGAGQRLVVVVSGRMRPGRFFRPSYSRPAVQTRHVWLGSTLREPQFDFSYLVAPIRTFSTAAPQIRLRLRCPEDWQLTGLLAGRKGGRMPAAARKHDWQEIRTTVDGKAVDRIDFAVTLPPRVLFHGGPLLGVGGTLDQPHRFRLRLGYEVAAPAWLFHNVNIETDFDREVFVVPTVHAASDGVFGIIPSLSAGVGLPIRVYDRREVGVRLELTLQWPLLGLVATFDFFPGVETGDAEFFRAGLLAQIAL